MGLLGRIFSALTGRKIAAKYDAAQTSDHNRRHWANADYLSADAAGNPEVRRVLRARSRYEVDNNCYARGIVHSIANYSIGTGPRIQFQSKDRASNREAEQAFNKWAKKIHLAHKLRTARITQASSGEAFIQLVNNERLAKLGLPTLDLRLIEADQIATPMALIGDPKVVDGIRFDDDGNPEEYIVLNRHPGDVATVADQFGYEVVPADRMIHLFRRERPGQHRGIPELTAALPIFAQLRRYKQAVLDAAEQAARDAMFIMTTLPAGGEAAETDPTMTMEVERNEARFLPEGWQAQHLKPEQPAANFAETVHAYLSECGRVAQIPAMIVTGDASNHNFASGRLDYQAFVKFIDVDRGDYECGALDVIADEWRREATLISGYLPQAFRTNDEIPYSFFWDEIGAIDQKKSADAITAELKAGVTSIPREIGKKGNDWEEVQQENADSLGLDIEEYREMLAASLLGGGGAVAAPAEDDDGEEAPNGRARKGAANV